MNQNRLWAIVSGALIIAVVALGFFLGVQPELAAADRARDDREAVEAQNLGLEATLSSLEQQAAEMPTIQADIETLRENVPDQVDESALLRELDAIAASSGARLLTYTPQELVAYLAAPEFANAIPSGVTGDTFAVKPMTISAEGSLEQVTAFVSGVQSATRLLLISDVVMTVDVEAGLYTADLTGSAYALAEGAQPSAPAEEQPAEALNE